MMLKAVDQDDVNLMSFGFEATMETKRHILDIIMTPKDGFIIFYADGQARLLFDTIAEGKAIFKKIGKRSKEYIRDAGWEQRNRDGLPHMAELIFG